uniref:TIL domain-containing protein n=1 Tax=Ornithodoros turicata TaxID=34597 RepID=A0A2R5LEC6_9ACAR
MKSLWLISLLCIAYLKINAISATSPVRPPDCGVGEVWRGCGSPCPLVCGKPHPTICTANCVYKCDCQEGYIRSGSENGPCIPLSECSEVPTSPWL